MNDFYGRLSERLANPNLKKSDGVTFESWFRGVFKEPPGQRVIDEYRRLYDDNISVINACEIMY